MSETLVSVIIPNYNSEKYIAATLDSVINQTYKNWECLVVDDCSKDSSTAIIEKYSEREPRIKLIRVPKNFGGPAGPRNLGLEAARGEYACFLDSDDLWHPRKIEIQLGFMLATGHEFTSTARDCFEGQWSGLNTDFGNLTPSQIQFDTISHGRLLRKNLISNSATMLKRSLIGKERFNESRPYIAVEDYHLWLRIHQTCAVSAKLRLPLLGYRLSPGSISSSKRIMSKKIWNLLGEYEMYGKPLGTARRFFYFGTFVFESVAARMGGRPT